MGYLVNTDLPAPELGLVYFIMRFGTRPMVIAIEERKANKTFKAIRFQMLLDSLAACMST